MNFKIITNGENTGQSDGERYRKYSTIIRKVAICAFLGVNLCTLISGVNTIVTRKLEGTPETKICKEMEKKVNTGNPFDFMGYGGYIISNIALLENCH